MGHSSLTSRMVTTLIAVIAICVLIRIVWELLVPLLPIIGGVLVVVTIAGVVIKRNRTW
jgi:hypothetical protein